MNDGNLIAVLLLTLLSLSVAGGVAITLVVLQHRRKAAPAGNGAWGQRCPLFPARTPACLRPAAWLAIRSRNLVAVQSALGLHDPKPCSWAEGLTGAQRLFIAPPVNGWILISGSDLPDPADDIDACFRFLLDLSRKLGHVQFFSVNRILNHHAWARLEAGRVVRAYVWAGRTLWNQGIKTRAEVELGLKCFQYFETPERTPFGQPDVTAANTERVPLLAARWSFDPAAVDGRVFEQARGIAGNAF